MVNYSLVFLYIQERGAKIARQLLASGAPQIQPAPLTCTSRTGWEILGMAADDGGGGLEALRVAARVCGGLLKLTASLLLISLTTI